MTESFKRLEIWILESSLRFCLHWKTRFIKQPLNCNLNLWQWLFEDVKESVHFLVLVGFVKLIFLKQFFFTKFVVKVSLTNENEGPYNKMWIITSLLHIPVRIFKSAFAKERQIWFVSYGHTNLIFPSKLQYKHSPLYQYFFLKL